MIESSPIFQINQLFVLHDMASEAKEEDKLPENLLGTVRINHVELDSAIPFWGNV